MGGPAREPQFRVNSRGEVPARQESQGGRHHYCPWNSILIGWAALPVFSCHLSFEMHFCRVGSNISQFRYIFCVLSNQSNITVAFWKIMKMRSNSGSTQSDHLA